MKPETARLLLSVPRLIDAPELFDFLGDVDAMRQTSRLETPRDCRRHIAGHERQRRKVGYGPWTVRTKADGEIVGFGGLYDDPSIPVGESKSVTLSLREHGVTATPPS
jgi:RimJ/RimL family protein N-acetyltransferase